MSINVQGATGATQWTDWAGAPKRQTEPERERTTVVAETATIKTAAPTRPATPKLTQQDFEVAMRLKAGATMNRTLDQLVDVEKIDRRGFDPVEDRKQVTQSDRVTTSLRNAALRYKTAAPTPAEVVEAPSETTTASTAATAWAYKPQSKHEFGQQYVLDALAAYQRNASASATTATTRVAAAVTTTVAAVTAPVATVVSAATTPATTTSTQPAATTSPAPASTTQPAATTSPTPTQPAAATQPTTAAAPKAPDLAAHLTALLNTLLGKR
ncbi:hypothetical protein OJ997_05210 [Solirubrobacter phytolaccae]|uniref:Uncharacterized protein n=1 Tax=Solirubrobacter phytolaccae TaxID=1404360 RepID=A0A9X3N741_9ACTN|nr:hypothetical protein [Solirubrobacter phytolaccae]MDA0179685.1 hypothetical protein [Solirubrobacter phytolaccae]